MADLDHDMEMRPSAYARIHDLKAEFIDRAWFVCLAISSVAVPLSVSRVSSTGWLAVYSLHVAVFATLVVGYIFRARLSHQSKLAMLTICLMFVGGWGMLRFGLLGSGVWFFAIAAILAGVSHSGRVGTAIFMGSVLFLSICGYGFATGQLLLDFDVIGYATSPHSWVLLILVSSFMPALVLIAFGHYQRMLVALALDMERQRDLIAEEALYDELTRLPRRQLLYDRMQMALRRAKRHGAKSAVLFIDLDDFKRVNDVHGHHAGDHVLVEVADRMRESLRADDTVARLGGDEFVVILSDLTHYADAEGVAAKLVQRVREPIEYRGLELGVGASVGIALLPLDGETIEEIMERSDQAMYRSKKGGKGRISFHPASEKILTAVERSPVS